MNKDGLRHGLEQVERDMASINRGLALYGALKARRDKLLAALEPEEKTT